MKSAEEFYSSKDMSVINKFRIKYYLGNVDKEITVSRKKYMLFDDNIILGKETCKDTERELKVFLISMFCQKNILIHTIHKLSVTIKI